MNTNDQQWLDTLHATALQMWGLHPNALTPDQWHLALHHTNATHGLNLGRGHDHP